MNSTAGFPFFAGPDTTVIVAPIDDKYGQWVCECGSEALWNLDTGAGWCDSCGLSLIATGPGRAVFSAAPDEILLVPAHLDSLPRWVTESAEGGQRD